MKSAGTSWRAMLAETMTDLDMWIRPMVKPADGFEYYEMMPIYVDYILAVSHAPEGPMDALAELYKLKAGSAICQCSIWARISRRFSCRMAECVGHSLAGIMSRTRLSWFRI